MVEADTGTIVSLNPALAEMHGGTVGDFVGKPLLSLFTAESAAQIPDVSATADETPSSPTTPSTCGSTAASSRCAPR